VRCAISPVIERLRSSRFDPDAHDASSFSCGVEHMDVWLHEHAHTADVRGTALTWVWTQGSEMVGYYSLSAHRIARDQVPASAGRGGPIEIPAVLLGKLALDQRLRGQGLGEQLVADALLRVVAATQLVGARLVVVDALAEPVALFYERLGFTRVPGSLVLIQRVRDIAAALD
jgi:predicted GNAT family N-acyltransferase